MSSGTRVLRIKYVNHRQREENLVTSDWSPSTDTIILSGGMFDISDTIYNTVNTNANKVCKLLAKLNEQTVKMNIKRK